MDKVVALTKRRGFIYPSSEIYGGLSGFYDYGPYGVALKRAIRDLWWRHMVELRDDVVGLESTQGMFVDFKNVINSTRVRVPFGIAQQGRAFRNEITPGNFVFRVREFELMELEYFVKPDDDDRRFGYWREERLRWYTDVLGIKAERLRYFDHPKESLSHYSKQTTDIEYEFPFGWGELEGIADRTDYDLRVHQERSKTDLTFLDPDTNERYLPWVIEPAVSVDRIFVT